MTPPAPDWRGTLAGKVRAHRLAQAAAADAAAHPGQVPALWHLPVSRHALRITAWLDDGTITCRIVREGEQ